MAFRKFINRFKNRNFTAEAGPKSAQEKKGLITPTYGYEKTIEYPANLDDYDKFYMENSEVNSAINVKSDMTVGIGYFTESENKLAKELVDEYAELVGLDQILLRVVKYMLIYGFCPVERFFKPGRPAKQEDIKLYLKILLPKTVKIQRDEKGKVLGYKQVANGKTVYFKPSEIIWFVNNEITSPYGTSLIQPIMNLLKAKEKINEDMPKIIHRYASPLTVWESNQTIEPLKQAVTTRQADEDIFLGNVPPGTVRFQNLEIDPRGRFDNYLRIIDESILECLQAPILRYLRNATEASATKMLEVIDRHIEGIQRYIKRMVEGEIFAPLLLVQGIEDVPRLRWGLPRTGLENIKLTDIALLVEKGVITSKQGVDLLRKLGVPFEEEEIQKPETKPEA